MSAAQMAAELKISFEIICLISVNQREYLRKSAGKTGKISRRIGCSTYQCFKIPVIERETNQRS
jgi:hypothetical protein